MKGRELERVLALADELVEARARLERAHALAAEIAHERDIEERAPRCRGELEGQRCRLEEILRALEEQWVAQGPLVAVWQRAVDLAEQAEYAGADPAPFRGDVEEARRRVEVARLATREELDRLIERRAAIVDVALAAPVEVPLAEPVADDGRPEAARREALALRDYAIELEHELDEAHDHAVQTIAAAEAELARLGGIDRAAEGVSELEQQLPDRVELPATAPPSATRRLERAGVVAVTGA